MASLTVLATRVLQEACRLAIVGDSLNSDLGLNQMPTAWHNALLPDHWSGWGGSGLENGYSVTGGIFGVSRIAGWAQSGWTINPSGGAGDVNVWPCPFGDFAFGSDLAAGSVLIVPYSDNTLMGQFQGGDWQQDAITWRAILFRSSSNGLSAIQAQTRRIPTTGEPPGHLSSSVSLAVGYNHVDTALNALAERGDLLLNGASPNIDETGKNVYFLGWRVWRDETGLQISFAATGGSGVADHLNTAKVSDAAIAAYVAGYNVNTLLLWIGQNDGTIDATWKANVTAVIQRWRAAVIANGGTFRCLLVSQYVTSTSDITKVTAMETYLKEIAFQTTDVGVVKLGTTDNGFASETGGYLADGVHLTPTGAGYMAGTIQSLLGDALAPAAIDPPTGLAANSSVSGPMLSWDSQAGAVLYKVYRATTPSGVEPATGGEVIGTSTHTTYTDTTGTPGGMYYYSLTSINSDDYESVRSGEVSGIKSAAGGILPVIAAYLAQQSEP